MAENSDVIEERNQKNIEILFALAVIGALLLGVSLLPFGGSDGSLRGITNITCVSDHCTLYNGTAYSATDVASKVSGHYFVGECTNFYSTSGDHVVGVTSKPCVAPERSYTLFEVVTGVRVW
jgi:hypothetical protein